MKCETCKGRGLQFQSFPETVIIDGVPVSLPVLVPCPDCIGGISHCCQGENVDCAAEAGERRDRTRTG